MAKSDHYIERCKHGTVLGQCRCPGPKAEYVTDCPPECADRPETLHETIARLQRERDEAERTIGALKHRIGEQTDEIARLTRERDEARAVAEQDVSDELLDEILGANKCRRPAGECWLCNDVR